MAKKGGKSKGAISNGVHSNVSRATRRAMRAGYNQSADRLMNQMNALQKGKDIVMTIENPNREQTNKRFIRVRVSGKDYLQRMKDNSRIQKTAEPA